MQGFLIMIKIYWILLVLGSFTRMKDEDKWDLLDRIQENTEGWENDKGRESGINYDFECIKSFMETDEFS